MLLQKVFVGWCSVLIVVVYPVVDNIFYSAWLVLAWQLVVVCVVVAAAAVLLLPRCWTQLIGAIFLGTY